MSGAIASWRDLAFVMAGGAAGSALRYVVGRVMGPAADQRIPWHTLAVNVSGSFLIGALFAVATRNGWPAWWRPLLAVGVLGGFTTFSAYSLETVELMRTGRLALAAGYSMGSVALGLAACGLGMAVGRAI